MAHLLEHLLFIQTTGGREIKKELTGHGAVWNGSTSYDRTNYFETVTASDENLRWAAGSGSRPHGARARWTRPCSTPK